MNSFVFPKKVGFIFMKLPMKKTPGTNHFIAEFN